jgi:branched-chain amino acid transport system ATP-binding protein
MMVDAKIVFLDEVGAGVNRTLLNTIADAIMRLNKERGYTFCVIEHDMDFIGRLCDPVIVMAEGKVLAQGTVDQVKNDERVIEAYLGTGLKNKVKEDAAHAESSVAAKRIFCENSMLQLRGIFRRKFAGEGSGPWLSPS